MFAAKLRAIHMKRAHSALFIVQSALLCRKDTVAEWSKAPGSGPGSKERGFKSHRCQSHPKILVHGNSFGLFLQTVSSSLFFVLFSANDKI